MDAPNAHEEDKAPTASAALSMARLLPAVAVSDSQPWDGGMRAMPSVRVAISRSSSSESMKSEDKSRVGSDERSPGEAEVAVDTPSNPKKRHKLEPSVFAHRVAELEREITAVKKQLEAPALTQSRQLAAECLEMKRRSVFLNKKLTEHCHWMQRVSSLMDSAPLLEIARAMPSGDPECPGHQQGVQKWRETQQRGHCPSWSTRSTYPFDTSSGGDCPGGHCTQPGLTLSFLDEWRHRSSNEPLSRFILKERLKVVVDRSAARVSSLVQNYGPSPKALSLFPLQMESRGWHLATGVMVDTSVAFRCERMLPLPSVARVEDIATELWSSVVRDEVQRTFLPIVQESVLAHHEVDCCLWYHVLQFCTSSRACPVATVGSFQPLREHQDGKSGQWQISIKTVHDNYLYTFAADVAGDNNNDLCPSSGAPPAGSASPSSALDLGLSIREFSLSNNFVIGIRVTVTDAGVKLLLVGSAVFDLQHVRDPALELLQYLVTYLPIYEELYLQQYAIP